MRKLILVLLLLSSLPAVAQNVMAIPPQQCVWRAGDDPAWAVPTLDESAWQPISQWKSPPKDAHLWVRCHADLSSLQAMPHPSLQISSYTAYQVFFNGEMIGAAGNVRTGVFSMNTIRQFPVPASIMQMQPDMIALRITYRVFGGRSIENAYAPPSLSAADLDALATRRAGLAFARSADLLVPSICYYLIGIVGLMLLGLFYYDRSRTELLYLSISSVCSAALRANEFCTAALVNYPSNLFFSVWVIGNIAGPATFLLFFFAVARRRVPLFYWITLALGVMSDALSGISMVFSPEKAISLSRFMFALTDTHLMGLVSIVNSVAPFVAFWPYRQISSRTRPLAVLCMFQSVTSVLWFFVQNISDLSIFISLKPELLEIRALVTVSVLLALLALLFRDQRQVTEERALLAGEMHAASQIQRMLAPAKLETTPGVHIEVAFHPMREVGGDFYSCHILPGNRQRLLVGDVSGKGAAAAMTAAVLIGAAQQRECESPAALLKLLNNVMADMHVSGFATCLCAELSAEGRLILANAGHLAPYYNGDEIEFESALPLGISRDAVYSEETLQLASGDKLTFVSDGVVEAQSTAGELFGFDRTRALSNQSANQIAQAAQSYGQEDDITVLTLSFAPVGVVHA